MLEIYPQFIKNIRMGVDGSVSVTFELGEMRPDVLAELYNMRKVEGGITMILARTAEVNQTKNEMYEGQA